MIGRRPPTKTSASGTATRNMEFEMSAEQSSRGKPTFAIAASLSILLSLSALVFAAVRKPPSNKPHGPIRVQPVSYGRPNLSGAHPIPWSRIITDWAISIGTRFTG